MNVDSWRSLIQRPEWMADAECHGMDPELFFPAGGETTDNVKAICRRCDVQAECLAYAINLGEKHGIWGGVSERGRRRLRRAAGITTATGRPLPRCGTYSGYEAHWRNRTPICDACREAHRDYHRERRRRGGAARGSSASTGPTG